MSQVEKAVHGGDVWAHFPVIDFSSNVNPLGPPDGVIKAVRENLWRIAYYPDDRSSELRKAISEYGVGRDNLVLGNGSTEIIKTFIEAFIGRGDRVVIPSPTYSEYRYQALVKGAEVELLSFGGDLSFSPDVIAEALETRPRALFLCDPNNPTGRSLGRKVIRALVETAWEMDVLVFLDEAYVEFSGRPSLEKPWEYENLLVSRSLTKLYTLPGLRLGYGIAGERIAGPMERLRMPWNVNVLAQVAGTEALRDRGFVDRTRRFIESEREFLIEGIRAAGFEPLPTETIFFLINLGGEISSPELKRRLLKKGILVRDCSSFEGLGEDYIRVAVKLRDENQRLIDELRQLRGELRG